MIHWLLAAGVWMAAQDARSAASRAVAASPQTDGASPVVVRTAAGERVEGRIVSWRTAEGLLIRPAGAMERTIATADVVDVRAGDGPSRGGERRDGTWLIGTVDGDLLCGRVEEGDETRLSVRDAAFGVVPVALERVSFLMRRDVETAVTVEAAAGESTQDRVLLRNGDRAAGIVDRIDATGVSVQTGRQRQVLRWPVVQAVRLASAEASGAKAAEELQFRWEDAGGSVLVARGIAWQGDAAELARSDGVVRAAAATMRGVQVLGGRWRWLSDLEPASYGSIPYLDLKWPLARDRNVMGGPLCVAGVSAARGLGLHSAARVRWNLDGAYERLSARVGIDDGGGRWSDVSVEVRLDDRTVARFEHVRWHQAALPIDIDVAGAQRLDLMIDYGDNGDVQDRVDLMDAALVRKR